LATELPTEEAIAKRAGLTYRPDDIPGITRRRRGRGWSYHRPDGTLIRDPEERERVEALAVPPAWTNVWISPDPSGHLQATGRDERERKQYRYHPAWEEVRATEKFDRMVRFARALPRVRAQVDGALDRPGQGRERVLAAVLRLLEITSVRVGNDEYARENNTYGLTTIRDRHVTVEGNRIDMEFESKGGKTTRVSVEDERLAAIVEACQDIPGYEVFKWVDEEGEKQDVKSDDVNAFIREISEGDFTAKDFRTWAGTLHAFRHLSACDPPADEREADAHCLAAIDAVADFLGNTREVSRGAYVHSGILELYRGGKLHRRCDDLAADEGASGLSGAERALLEALEKLDPHP
jgi:DNA topoisomerase-1